MSNDMKKKKNSYKIVRKQIVEYCHQIDFSKDFKLFLADNNSKIFKSKKLRACFMVEIK